MLLGILLNVSEERPISGSDRVLGNTLGDVWVGTDKGFGHFLQGSLEGKCQNCLFGR